MARREALLPAGGARPALRPPADGGGAVELEGILARAREEEPDAVGAFVFGSHARGEATPTSDLDLRLITSRTPRVRYRTWFVDGQHVSIGSATLEELLAVGREPADWSLGFAVQAPAVWVWRAPELVAALGDPPTLEQPPVPGELEDFVEACAKALRAADPVALRVAARLVGETAVPLLRDLNEPVVVSTREEAAREALALAVAPEGWAGDLAALLGLAAADDERVSAAVRTVGAGVLRLLREHGARVGDAQPELTAYLLDGRLERHLGFA